MSTPPGSEQNTRWLAQLLGMDFLLWSPNIQPQGFLHWDRIFATRTIPRGAQASTLTRAESEIEVTFPDQGRLCDIDDLMRDEHLSGLIVLKNNQILLERYAPRLNP